MSTAADLAAALEAEFVIEHRAGSHPATPKYVADFLEREMRRVRPINCARPSHQFCALCGNPISERQHYVRRPGPMLNEQMARILFSHTSCERSAGNDLTEMEIYTR